MRLVPRQLRKTTFPGSVPYYGGRLTPQVIAGLGQQPAPPPTRTPAAGRAAAPPQTDQERQLAALARLRAQGVLTDEEHETYRRRVMRAAP